MYNKVDHYVYIPLFFIKRVSCVTFLVAMHDKVPISWLLDSRCQVIHEGF